MGKLTLFFVFAFFFVSAKGYAQQSISGIVVDSLTNEGLEGASILILNQRDSLLVSSHSAQNGRFSLKQLPNGVYNISIRFIGYKSQKYEVTLNSVIELKPLTIRLPIDNTLLSDVQIDIEPPMVVLKGDTTEYNAGSFTTEPYADADALIEQLPGVEIDDEGKVMVLGEDVMRVMVDGKEFFSTDPRIALKTLPADVIDKIQVIDEKSDQAKFTGFDDGDRRKIINIVTKPDRRNGYFGKFAAGYGNQERYNTGGSINAFQGNRRFSMNVVANNVNQQDFSMENLAADEQGGGQPGRRGNRGGGGGSGIRKVSRISANFNNEWNDKLKMNGNYSYDNSNQFVVSLLNREYIIGNRSNQFSLQNQQNSGKNNSHRAGFRLEYQLDTNNSISFRPNIRFQESSSIRNSINKTTLKTDEPINASIRDNDNERNNINVSGDFTYRRRLNPKGRTLTLTVNGSINSNKGLAHNLSLNEFYKNYLLNRVDTVNNENNTNAYGNGLTGRLAYTEPISKSSRLQANYSLRNTNNYSNRETFEFLAETGQFQELDTLLSNEFTNDYIYHSGGLGYLFSKETMRFNLGVDFQQAQLQNLREFPIKNSTSRSFASFLPNASFTYNFSKQKNIQINYRAATNAPNINQLQDVINNQNTLNIRVGNANLKQEYAHRISISYRTASRESGTNFSVNVNADRSNNRIVNSTLLASQDTLIGPDLLLGKGGRLTRPENVDGYYMMRANTSLGIPLKKLKMNMSLNGGVFYKHDIGLLNDELTYSNSSGINQRISINSKISQKVIFSLAYSGSYNMVRNNLNPDLSYNFYNQNLRNNFIFIFWKGLRASSTFSYNYNTGLTSGGSQSFVLWNAALGKKLFKQQEAEISLTIYDILNSNTTIARSISDQYIEDRESNMLNQYLILSFTYNIRKFAGGNKGSAMSGGNRGSTMGSQSPRRRGM